MTDTHYKAIQTIPERCRVCYTCVRECPAKAIKIDEGQALVVHERCIGCGNCVRVCSQNAKVVIDSMQPVKRLLEGDKPVAAIIAPSFPSEFTEYDHKTFVGMLRGVGFKWVNEVAFGADLVAKKYKQMLAENSGSWIATTCPAVVLYIEKYFPDLLENLAPIVSPMIAIARVLKHMHGDDIRVVFVGPCTSKKREGVDRDLNDEVDEVLTFIELRNLFEEKELEPDKIEPADFDTPHAGFGALFPLSGGMLQAANLHEDLIQDDIVSANGGQFSEAVREFAAGDMNTQLLELLACDGCIMGAGTQSCEPIFRRRARISTYTRECVAKRDKELWQSELDKYENLDLSRSYSNRDQRITTPDNDVIRAILEKMGKLTDKDELNCGACGYETCRDHAEAIHKGLAESEMCLPHTIDRLNSTVADLEDSNCRLADTQDALMQSERLASMGQLAAGIAHEVNNPLGVVLMYAHLMIDDLDKDSEHLKDAQVIAEQADRCKKIVAGLLHFARQNKVLREPTDIPHLIDRCVQAVACPENIEITVTNKMNYPEADVDADQILQVLVNLVSNAYAAMTDGGTLEIELTDTEDTIAIAVKDNGVGIAPEHRSKIFEPFFTTKQLGKGTGLGLAVTYGIVKMHRGDLQMTSNHEPKEGPTGTVFTIKLPRKEEV